MERLCLEEIIITQTQGHACWDFCLDVPANTSDLKQDKEKHNGGLEGRVYDELFLIVS